MTNIFIIWDLNKANENGVLIYYDILYVNISMYEQNKKQENNVFKSKSWVICRFKVDLQSVDKRQVVNPRHQTPQELLKD